MKPAQATKREAAVNIGPGWLRRALRRPSGWGAVVPVVCLAAGVGFATSAHESHGTDLRAPGVTSLADTVRAAEARVHQDDRQVRALQSRLDALRAAGQGSGAGTQHSLAPLQRAAGLTAVQGAGLQVVLDDAPGSAAGTGSGSGVDVNQLVVHQSDLQAVVNALWAGGAQALSINGQRLLPTSAVRCVGPTLLLNGEVYSPPYRIAAIGPAGPMEDRLAASHGVHEFEQAAEYYGLGYTVSAQPRVEVASYTGSVTLVYAHAGH